MFEKKHSITLLLNANKTYDRKVIEGIGHYLQTTKRQLNVPTYICSFRVRRHYRQAAGAQEKRPAGNLRTVRQRHRGQQLDHRI